jgi:NO-binding membrane sensor protein with MHYT domain
MSKKSKRQSSTTSFSLSRRVNKIFTAKPSSLVISIIVIGYAVFLFSGGLYTIISEPYPELGQQFVSDTVIALTLYAMGFSGLLAIYQSTKYAYKPRQAYMMLVIGVTLLLLAYIFLESSIAIKLG